MQNSKSTFEFFKKIRYMNFKGKTYFITGATSDIGLKLCHFLDTSGANLIIFFNNNKKLIQLKKKISNKNHTYIKLDFNKPEKIQSFIETKSKNFENIDGLINLAGLHILKPALNSTISDLNKIININYISPIILINYLIKKKIFSKNASIILMSSVSSLKSDQGLSLYSSMKLAQKSYFKTLINEISNKEILINFISPGLIKSATLQKIKNFTSPSTFSNLKKKHLKGFGKDENIIQLIFFLLSKNSNWIHGSDIIIDGGYSLS